MRRRKAATANTITMRFLLPRWRIDEIMYSHKYYLSWSWNDKPRKTLKETKKARDDKIISARGSYTPISITKVKNRCDYVFPQLLLIGDTCVAQYNTSHRWPALTECACSLSSPTFQDKLLRFVGCTKKCSSRNLIMPEDTSSGNQAKWARWYCRQWNSLLKREHTFGINSLLNTAIFHEREFKIGLDCRGYLRWSPGKLGSAVWGPGDVEFWNPEDMEKRGE